MVRCFIALGSNVGNPRKQVETAIKELTDLPKTKLLTASSLYKTKPVGFVDQPFFINAVVEIETTLDPEVLLDTLLDLEKQHGRVRGERHWAPRTLDLDILLYGDEEIDLPHLKIPHPRMHEREFVLVPLAEIAPEIAKKWRKQ